MIASDKYFEYAFFSAYTTIPSFSDPESFFKDDILIIFEDYKKSLREVADLSTKYAKDKSAKAPESPMVYEPIPYCIFGDFDLAIFSLIDDFSFASKKFKPRAGGKNFKYQVNTGIIPSIEIYKDEFSKLKTFQDGLLPKFFSGEEFYPFTGITTIKLNSSMLVGIGQEFIDMINYFLVSLIDEYIERKKIEKKGFKLFYIINENLGWNELTIYFFGNSIEDINEISLLLKKNRLRDILNSLKKLKNAAFSILENKEKQKTISDKLKSESLLSFLIKKEKKKKGTGSDYLESHPIVASSTIFGYHIDNIKYVKKDGSYDLFKIENVDEQNLLANELDKKIISIEWNIKPGHEKNANSIIQQLLLKKVGLQLPPDSTLEQSFQDGKFCFVFPETPISFLEYFIFFSSATTNEDYRQNIIQNVVKFKSRVILKNRIEYSYFNKLKHYNYKLDVYTIDEMTFNQIRSKLRTYPVPHTIKGQIENLILNFNDAITDPLMYNYFIGLKSPLLLFLKDKLAITDDVDKTNIISAIDKIPISANFRTVDKIFKDDTLYDNVYNKNEIISVDVQEFIGFIKSWSKAYWNRHFHDYYFAEISDFNIEHHGGIQQILFCYDVIYKIISKRIYGSFSKEPFVNVRIATSITSTVYTNTINFTHLFKPSIYACECVHEVANHVIPHIVLNCNNPEFSFLLNPRNQLDENVRERGFRFEKKIKDKLGSKDAFEVKFIEEYFGLNSIRYLFTDYLTFMLMYNFDKKSKFSYVNLSSIEGKNNLKVYYHTHWFLFLTRPDLYSMNENEGSWYFNEDHFRFLFIRCNLMFYLMCDYDEQKLIELNEECPSVELAVLWNTQKKSLINFVVRLGESLKSEFKSMDDGVINTSFESFAELIRSNILKRTPDNDVYKNFYKEIIELNHDLILSFHDHFKKNSTEIENTNILIRNSSNNPEISGIESNIAFYENHSRTLFLDPKGNIFSTSEEKRKEILKTNIGYLKNCWDVSMKASKTFFTKSKR